MLTQIKPNQNKAGTIFFSSYINYYGLCYNKISNIYIRGGFEISSVNHILFGVAGRTLYGQLFRWKV